MFETVHPKSQGVEHIYIIITSLQAHCVKEGVCTVTALPAKSYHNKNLLIRAKLGL